jgi:hypothetical protein
MSSNLPLYYKALLAWHDELEKQYIATLEDRLTKLRDGTRQKIAEMFGPEYVVQVENRDDDPYDSVLEVEVENLRFIAFRSRGGGINISLLMECPRCGHQMPSNPLTHLADLGRELLRFETSGSLSDHECSEESELP